MAKLNHSDDLTSQLFCFARFFNTVCEKEEHKHATKVTKLWHDNPQGALKNYLIAVFKHGDTTAVATFGF